MSNDTLKIQLKESTTTLLELARETCWNTLSNECVYLITRISESDDSEIKKKKLPRNTKLLTLEELAVELEKLYPQIYDLCFFIYEAQKSRTIIELQYFPKSALDPDFLLEVQDQAPMIHHKIKIPPYWQDRTKPFDVNWELGGFKHHWCLFLAKFRILMEGFYKKWTTTMLRTQPEEHYVITWTNESLKVTHPKYGVEQIQWAAIEKIELVTTDEGPWLPDVWLVLSGGGNICSIPQGAKHYEEVYDKISVLPDFDFEAVLSATRCTDNARFMLWKKSV